MSRPLSVLLGHDPEALKMLIDIHAQPGGGSNILDCTFNTGKMWRKCEYQPAHTMDVDPQYDVDTIGDCRDLPFPDETFDVIVFDPPHLPTSADSPGSSKIWRDRFGLTAQEGLGRDGHNVSPLFGPFLDSASRVLRRKGVALVKLADIIHAGRYQWHLVDFINEVRARPELTACDLLVKKAPAGGQMTSSKWKTVRHLRRCHSYWIVVRKGGCEACR